MAKEGLSRYLNLFGKVNGLLQDLKGQSRETRETFYVRSLLCDFMRSHMRVPNQVLIFQGEELSGDFPVFWFSRTFLVSIVLTAKGHGIRGNGSNRGV